MRPKRSTVITFLVVLLLAAAGTVAYVLVKLEVFAPSLSEQVSKVEQAPGSWWLGRSFEGLPLTLARPAGGQRVDDLGYGACQRFGGKLDPFTSTRCGYPLLVQVRKRKYALSLDDDVPKRLDGSCWRTTVRGAPVAVGPNGSILYTGNLAIAVLGRPDQVGRALARIRPVQGAARFERPDPDVAALSSCIHAPRPFASLPSQLAGLRKAPGLPLAWVGEWYAGGRLTSARAGRQRRGAHLHELRAGVRPRLVPGDALALEPAGRPRIAARDALRRHLPHVLGRRSPGVAWTKDLAGETGGGVIVFTGPAMLTLANDITLEKIPISRLEAVARLVRALPPARVLPKPQYATAPLLAACAERAPACPPSRVPAPSVRATGRRAVRRRRPSPPAPHRPVPSACRRRGRTAASRRARHPSGRSSTAARPPRVGVVDRSQTGDGAPAPAGENGTASLPVLRSSARGLPRSVLAERSSRRQAASPSRQCGSAGAPFSLRRIDTAGRGARAPNSAVVIRLTRQSSPPPRRSPRRSRPRCSPRPRRGARPRTPRPRRRAPAWRRRDDRRRWGSRAGRRRPTTSSRSAPRRSIVRTKLCPVGPNSHELRTIQARSPAAASAWSFVRP